ncbi:hypothetical protein ACGF7U_19125 [Micromonospora sp. NPDC047670]|uniref:hypothetical protein n=1 Tax=Micromonospora sp. NPDC047670 TaxID=3364252 RepID=UPI003724AE8E
MSGAEIDPGITEDEQHAWAASLAHAIAAPRGDGRQFLGPPSSRTAHTDRTSHRGDGPVVGGPVVRGGWRNGRRSGFLQSGGRSSGVFARQ